jgi:hypothetical protein
VPRPTDNPIRHASAGVAMGPQLEFVGASIPDPQTARALASDTIEFMKTHIPRLIALVACLGLINASAGTKLVTGFVKREVFLNIPGAPRGT